MVTSCISTCGTSRATHFVNCGRENEGILMLEDKSGLIQRDNPNP